MQRTCITCQKPAFFGPTPTCTEHRERGTLMWPPKCQSCDDPAEFTLEKHGTPLVCIKHSTSHMYSLKYVASFREAEQSPCNINTLVYDWAFAKALTLRRPFGCSRCGEQAFVSANGLFYCFGHRPENWDHFIGVPMCNADGCKAIAHFHDKKHKLPQRCIDHRNPDDFYHYNLRCVEPNCTATATCYEANSTRVTRSNRGGDSIVTNYPYLRHCEAHSASKCFSICAVEKCFEIRPQKRSFICSKHF